MCTYIYESLNHVYLFEVVIIDLHYMTERQELFDLKISKLKILWKHLHLGWP